MRNKVIVWSLVCVFIISILMIGCKTTETVTTTAAETTAAETTAAAPILGTEGLTYWIEKAGIKPSGEFTIYSYKNEGVTEYKIAQKYVETYPDVKFNWVTVPGEDYASKIATELETNTANFDCFWSYAAWTIQFSKFLEDVTSKIPKELRDDILKGVVSATAVGDTWYSAPLFTSIYSLIYNKEILKNAGYEKAPQTWDEFFKCAEAVQKGKEIYGIGNGIVGQFGYIVMFQIVIHTIGGEFWNNDRQNPQPLFNNEKGVRALQIMKKIYKSNFSDPSMAQGDEFAMRRAIASGKSAMGFHGVGVVEAIVEKDFPENKGKFDYSLIPSDPGFETCSTNGSMGFAIRKGGNVDAALGFVLFYLSPDMQKFMTQDYGFPTSRASLANDEKYVSEFPYVRIAVEQANYKTVRYTEENTSALQQAFFPIFENYLNGKIDEKSTLSQLEKAFIDAWKE